MSSILKERAERIKKVMSEKKFDAMLIAGVENYYYISGDIRRQARMLFPREGEPTIIVFADEVELVRKNTWIEDIRGWRNVQELARHFFDAMKEKKLSEATVGFDTHAAPGFEVFKFRKWNPKINMVENDDVMLELRMIKSADEIEAMRNTAKIADSGMHAARETIAPGATENDVAAEAEYAMRKAGSERLGAISFVNSGQRSIYLHGFVTHKKIERGDVVVVDLHPVANMYACDLARTFVAEKPDEAQKRAYAAYYHAQKLARESVKPGWKVGDVTKLMGEQIQKTEYGSYVVPGYIHGVGLEFEEYPHPSHYAQHSNILLKPNMTVTIGHAVLPVPGVGGFRIEDTIRITEDGAEPLTNFNRELI